MLQGHLNHVLDCLQVVGAVLHIDEDVVEAGGREGPADLRRPVHLQAASKYRLALRQPFPSQIRAHFLTIA